MDNKKTAGSSCSCTQRLEIKPLNRLTENIPVSEILTTTSTITYSNRLDHFLARWGVNRMGHIVKPGLYRLGNPTPDSPVFVSANYTLSFDAVRSALTGIDCYILVLDTKGVNVWCAAGKGTFGTDELVNRISKTGLSEIVSHRKLVLPQLGAPGVSAHEVTKQTGFSVVYGPVRAKDIKAFLDSGFKATEEMRTVKFTMWDRLVLTPIELVAAAKFSLVVFGILFLLNLFAARPFGLADFIVYTGAVLTGTVITPLLLPVIPGRAFAWKGWLLGLIASSDDHAGRPGSEVLVVGAPGAAPGRVAEGRHRHHRRPDVGQGRQEQGRPALQAGGVRHPLRPWHLPRGRAHRHGRRPGLRPQGRRLVHLRGRPARPGQGECPQLPQGQPGPRRRARAPRPARAPHRRARLLRRPDPAPGRGRRAVGQSGLRDPAPTVEL